jgi:hypothetical protein
MYDDAPAGIATGRSSRSKQRPVRGSIDVDAEPVAERAAANDASAQVAVIGRPPAWAAPLGGSAWGNAAAAHAADAPDPATFRSAVSDVSGSGDGSGSGDRDSSNDRRTSELAAAVLRLQHALADAQAATAAAEARAEAAQQATKRRGADVGADELVELAVEMERQYSSELEARVEVRAGVDEC